VYGFPFHKIICPAGSFKPINFTAASFRMNADESEANCFEKSLPSLNCQPTVFPKSADIPVFGKSTVRFGSFPF